MAYFFVPLTGYNKQMALPRGRAICQFCVVSVLLLFAIAASLLHSSFASPFSAPFVEIF